GLFRTGYANGVTVGDYNNDGFEDLFITYYGQNVLYRNNGDGTFTDVTKEAGLLHAAPRFDTGCTFVDYDRDGRLDLFVSNYAGFDTHSVPRASEGICNAEKIICGPVGLPYGKHLLYHNNGDGTFSDVTEAAGIGKAAGGWGLTAVAADFHNDGWPDIFLACDTTPSLFFRNNRDGTFSEEGLESGVALSDDGQVQAGMGLAVGDFRLDGSLHIVKTHYMADTPAVLVNNGKGSFEDATLRSGLAVETRFVTWGVGIQDLDNDGNPDIFWVTGSITPEMEKRPGNPPNRSPRVVFRNLGKGRFEELIAEAGPGVEAVHTSRGCAFGDFDNDGDVDVVIVNLNEPPSLLRNDVSGENHWIKIKLTGVKSNRSAIGTRVVVRYGGKVQAQEVLAQSSYLSVSDSRLHFGLGSAGTADIEIRWPLGLVEKLTQVAADQLICVTEGAGITRTERFAASPAPAPRQKT
ncbi:MAG: CRTAC1 family protein, partial [Bryobacteraceae bacterium]